MDAGSADPDFDDEPLGPFRLRATDGTYLARADKGFTCTPQKERAATFETEYGLRQTREILKVFGAELGTELTIDELTEVEQFEFCDACGQFARPTDLHFNGRTFLCVHCRAQGARAKSPNSRPPAPSSDASAH